MYDIYIRQSLEVRYRDSIYYYVDILGLHTLSMLLIVITVNPAAGQHNTHQDDSAI